MGWLGEVGQVARYELGEALRTRLFQLVMLAYVGGVGFANWVLVQILKDLEARFASMMGVPPTDRPGTMIAVFQRNGELQRLLESLLGSEDAARALVEVPILATWSGAAAMGLLPVVLVFTAAGSVATEVRSRSLRYLLVRTDRLVIVLGKALGQLVLGGLAAGAGAVVSVGMALVLMAEVPLVPLVEGVARTHALACLYAIPWLGVALAASQVVGNPNGARLLAGACLLGSPAAAWWIRTHTTADGPGRLLDPLALLLPTNLWGALWSPEPAVMLLAVLHGLVLALGALGLGGLRFARRDL